MTDYSSIELDKLPPQIRGFVRLIGVAETWLLLDARGGRPTYIPADTVRPSILHDIISAESVATLAESEYGGRTVDMPMVDKLVLQIRNAEIRAQKHHATKADLAQRFGLTTRMIQLIWNHDADRDNLTIDMFGDSGSQ